MPTIWRLYNLHIWRKGLVKLEVKSNFIFSMVLHYCCYITLNSDSGNIAAGVSVRWLARKTGRRERRWPLQDERNIVSERLWAALCVPGLSSLLSHARISKKHQMPISCSSYNIENCNLPIFSFQFYQAVHSIFDGCPGKEWEPEEKRINKLVFIGRNLDETALRKGFKGCLVWEEIGSSGLLNSDQIEETGSCSVQAMDESYP